MKRKVRPYWRINQAWWIASILTLCAYLCTGVGFSDGARSRQALDHDESDLLLRCLGDTGRKFFVSMRVLKSSDIGPLVAQIPYSSLCEYLQERNVRAYEVLPSIYSNHPTNSYVRFLDERVFQDLAALASEQETVHRIKVKGAPVSELSEMIRSATGLNVIIQGAVWRRCWIRCGESVTGRDVILCIAALARIDGWQIKKTDNDIVITIPEEPRARNILTKTSVYSVEGIKDEWSVEWKLTQSRQRGGGVSQRGIGVSP